MGEKLRGAIFVRKRGIKFREFRPLVMALRLANHTAGYLHTSTGLLQYHLDRSVLILPRDG